MDYILKIMNIEDEPNDMRKFVVVRPAGFSFEPGKSVLISINKPGLEDNKKLCTFFSLNNDYYLELIFKEESYKDENLPFFKIKAGEEIILSDVVGNIEYKEPGAFIAAGKGLFPFLNIFKHLQKLEALSGNKLIYFARSENELIFPRMLNVVFKNNCSVILGKDLITSGEVKKVDENLLRQKLPTLQQQFYVAGPRYFVENVVKVLQNLGIVPQTEIIE